MLVNIPVGHNDIHTLSCITTDRTYSTLHKHKSLHSRRTAYLKLNTHTMSDRKYH